MSNKGIEVIYDEEYMYPLPGESDTDFKLRMAKLDKERAASMTEEEKRQVAELMKLVTQDA